MIDDQKPAEPQGAIGEALDHLMMSPRWSWLNHQWWKHQGGQELRRLLIEQWDPMGVKDWPEAADEYDGYRGAIVQLLRRGASPQEIADYLSAVEGLQDDARAALLPVGQRLLAWYAESLPVGDMSPSPLSAAWGGARKSPPRSTQAVT